jgi:anaerobic magnesium-protoporphyrin IX monomethyl ester cyclase
MDEQLATALRRAGFENIVFGIESGDPEVLRKIGKRTPVEKSKQAIMACNKAGLKTTASFVIGLPFDTPETIRKTIELAFELKPTLVAFNPLVPFPGAAVFDQERHTPSSIDGWEKYVTVGVPPYSFVKGYSPEALHRLATRGHRRFYMRPVQILRI